ncbi:MAG: hypothetical protein WDM78_21045 [Puia sp.]
MIPEKNERDSSAQTAFFADDAIAPKSNLKISNDNKLYDIGTKNGKTASGRPTVAGYVRDIKNRGSHYGRQHFCRYSLDQQGYRSIRILYAHPSPWPSYYPDQQRPG